MYNADPSLSEPEVMVANWLYEHGILFDMQVNMFGGVSETGGAKVDFILILLNIALRVQSYWHTLAEVVARDKIQKIKLTTEGYVVVDVYEDDLRENLDNTMSKAVKGIEVHSY